MIDTDFIDQTALALLDQQHIPGLALLIAHKGKPVHAKGYGLANVELDVPVVADTLFEIASITKLFTATAVLQLVAAGQVALGASIREYLPQLPAAWETAQIRHILSHTSGLFNYTDPPEYWQTTRLDISRQQILDLVLEKPLQFPAGSSYAYSNTGYYLLGMMIEAVSGQTYGDYLTQHIFAPLGMSATRMNDPYAITPGRAAGYTWRDGELRNAEYYSNAGTFAAGALLSSIADLSKWDAALSGGDSILPQQVLNSMWTPQRKPTPTEQEYGFTTGWGWFVFSEFQQKPRRWAGYNGGITGFASALIRFLDEQVTVLLLINRDNFDRPDYLINDIAAHVLAQLSQAE